ncbi:LCP family protein [Pectinatus sottacetonis]|uniref:LCP family protein n=1 Tax=Pectinatus sottacetonis TaxID=1002795 RepID=UPI0018C5D371|nr:LCP family protein [Pectinatus sottacetonis]
MDIGVLNMQKKKKTYLPIIILLLVFLVAAGCGAIFAGFLNTDHKTDKEKGMLVAADKATVMIMGVDSRHDDVGRSDTLMVATIDPKKNQAALLSIPRDTRVKIKNHGWDKINAAYAYGGHNLTRDTVEQFLGVPMDHYVVINMEAFEKIIDDIGGVDIDVEKRMYYNDPWDDNGGLHINFQPGMQHMDGKTAIEYVRYRDSEGDIGRIKRQQKFMKAVMDKVLSPAIIPRIPAIVAEVFHAVKTDMSIRQLLAFLGSLKEAQNNGLKTAMIPGTPMYINGISYWIPDIKKLRYALADTLDINMTPAMLSSMENTALEYKTSIPATAKELPRKNNEIGHIEDTSHNTKKYINKNSSIDNKKSLDKNSLHKTSNEFKEPSGADSTPSQGNNASVPVRGNQAIGKN